MSAKLYETKWNNDYALQELLESVETRDQMLGAASYDVELKSFEQWGNAEFVIQPYKDNRGQYQRKSAEKSDKLIRTNIEYDRKWMTEKKEATNDVSKRRFQRSKDGSGELRSAADGKR